MEDRGGPARKRFSSPFSSWSGSASVRPARVLPPSTTSSTSCASFGRSWAAWPLAMTPIMITGGHRPVGRLPLPRRPLCAILFGKLWRDAGLSPAAATACTLGFGALAGGLNAVLIAGLRLPALIVTLGTYSLFRGVAEAITRGVDTFTDFPASFLFFGQDRWLGIPAQAPVLAARRHGPPGSWSIAPLLAGPCASSASPRKMPGPPDCR